MLRHITFATDDMLMSADICNKSALEWGCNESLCFRPDLIDSTFWAFNSEIFTQSRGYGYWLWKPYFIYLNLMQMEEKDKNGLKNYLIYTDAGVEFIDHVNNFNSMDQKVFLFGNMYNHEHWCKGNVTDEILGDRKDKKQAQASAMIFNVCDEARKFVKEWLMWCQMPGFIDDSPGLGNDPEFREHRHDQAILTCLAYKHGYRLHWWPAMYNDGQFVYPKDKEYEGDKYNPVFNHHRKRNDQW